mmetsp:Transcript_14126/g.40146  ORF Transcript_14126/g.40146 Transcript_14126/m.40146 type:complete len:338 (+) Transcript_14126:134-1147(+)
MGEQGELGLGLVESHVHQHLHVRVLGLRLLGGLRSLLGSRRQGRGGWCGLHRVQELAEEQALGPGSRGGDRRGREVPHQVGVAGPRGGLKGAAAAPAPGARRAHRRWCGYHRRRRRRRAGPTLALKPLVDLRVHEPECVRVVAPELHKGVGGQVVSALRLAVGAEVKVGAVDALVARSEDAPVARVTEGAVSERGGRVRLLLGAVLAQKVPHVGNADDAVAGDLLAAELLLHFQQGHFVHIVARAGGAALAAGVPGAPRPGLSQPLTKVADRRDIVILHSSTAKLLLDINHMHAVHVAVALLALVRGPPLLAGLLDLVDQVMVYHHGRTRRPLPRRA